MEKKRERPSDGFQNRLKMRQDSFGLKNQNHGAQLTLTSVEVFDGKIEKASKRGEEGVGIFPNVHIFVFVEEKIRFLFFLSFLQYQDCVIF